jgi:hypothetical protein
MLAMSLMWLGEVVSRSKSFPGQLTGNFPRYCRTK